MCEQDDPHSPGGITAGQNCSLSDGSRHHLRTLTSGTWYAKDGSAWLSHRFRTTHRPWQKQKLPHLRRMPRPPLRCQPPQPVLPNPAQTVVRPIQSNSNLNRLLRIIRRRRVSRSARPSARATSTRRAALGSLCKLCADLRSSSCAWRAVQRCVWPPCRCPESPRFDQTALIKSRPSRCKIRRTIARFHPSFGRRPLLPFENVRNRLIPLP